MTVKIVYKLLWYILLLYHCEYCVVNVEIFKSLNGILPDPRPFVGDFTCRTRCVVGFRRRKRNVSFVIVALHFADESARFVYGNWRHTSVIICVNRYGCRYSIVSKLGSPRKFSETSPPLIEYTSSGFRYSFRHLSITISRMLR